MEYIYKEIKEEKRCRGCIASRLFIRYPTDVGSERLNVFISSEVNAFKTYINQSAFTDGENELIVHLSAGGRRSTFSPTVFQLFITACDTEKGLLRIDTEVSTVKGGNVTAIKSFSELFSSQNGCLYRKRKGKRHT